MKRKRKPHSKSQDDQQKRRKIAADRALTHPVLTAFYPKLQTLREYLLCRLSGASKRRRQILVRIGKQDLSERCPAQREILQALGLLLDHALVGTFETDLPKISEDDQKQQREHDYLQFSQHVGGSTLASSADGKTVTQVELVDFVLWMLFNKIYPGEQRPPHVLCHGVQRAASMRNIGLGCFPGSSVPGLASMFPNEHLERVKDPIWSKLLNTLGTEGDRIMVDLLVHASIFIPLESSPLIFYQLSGRPLSELNPIATGAMSATHCGVDKHPNSKTTDEGVVCRKAADIRFVRHRMLHAKPALNAKGEVCLGLRHIHVFNRYPDASKPDQTAHVMQYLFPRQFGLHNVFTSKVDSRETMQPFKDYTLREHEISEKASTKKCSNMQSRSGSQRPSNLPRRLRGRCFNLVQKLQKRHAQCSYTQLLRHYCPIPACLCDRANKITLREDANQQLPHFTSLASSTAQVSAFCRATLQKVFPFQLLGCNAAKSHNWKILSRNIDAFVKARRFETNTLEDMMHGLEVRSFEWLCPPNLDQKQNMALSDYEKRREIIMELVYYIFDSFLIPLIRSNFHVTESSVHRNRLFYFRHDVWRKITEPALTHLRTSMFAEIRTNSAQQIISRRTLGYSEIRLLPKDNGMRPIANLKKRMQIIRNGSKILGRSINTTMTPAFNVLNFEKSKQPEKLGNSLFSISGMFDRLRQFQESFQRQDKGDQQLYFAKVDITSCFDNLPQDKLIQLTHELLSNDEYFTKRLTEMQPIGGARAVSSSGRSKTSRKFRSETNGCDNFKSFAEMIRPPDQNKSSKSVFVDSVIKQSMSRHQTLQLLEEHISQNIVKIDKKFYHQKKGIPQGSILSSLLCNLLYAEFEYKRLHFLSREPHLMLRLIDDFLLITPSRHLAQHFLQVMHQGDSEFGVFIKPEKSLVNFKTEISGMPVPQLGNATDFPYCGMTIDTQSLNIRKDSASFPRTRTSDTLTVEYSKFPGQSFRRKMLSALKIQLHVMLLDMSYNSRDTVISNVYQLMVESAMRTVAYIRCMPLAKRASSSMVRGLVEDIVALISAKTKSMSDTIKKARSSCRLDRITITWLACSAFLSAFSRRQSRYRELIEWLETKVVRYNSRNREESRLLRRSSIRRRRRGQEMVVA